MQQRIRARDHMRIILASASPRRRELLKQIGLNFEVIVSPTDEETSLPLVWERAKELSRRKAGAVFGALPRDEEVLVMGADTLVALEERILGKPGDEKSAGEMLEQLSGRTHQVYTGVTLMHRDSSGRTAEKTFYEVTQVSFYPMSRQEILAYAVTGDPLDKAGAYGIQGLCARYIQRIGGDYNNGGGVPGGRLFQGAEGGLV